MKKKLVFLVCLLISAGLGGAVVSKSIAIPIRSLPNTLSADIPTPAADLSGLVLRLQDLPAGFREMPPATIQKLVSGLQSLKPASVFAYNKSDDRQFQLIIGFTKDLTNAIDRTQFDGEMGANIFAEEFSKGLNSSADKEVQFTTLTALSLEEKIGDVSRGWTNKGKIRGVTMNVEIAVFRRGKIGNYLIMMYLDGHKPAVTISEVARQLDKRIVELKPELTQPQ
ncbi:MAG: hypothetical protein JGK17_27790 [Microcoleus sp. PH2017_10_PVI_O_A]|uniref:hypothetical protein n=1 Tax=unclassified Microcoleus TaxID=2642155 RepID=UPI001DE02743|nr:MULTISPECIES: hypothetical protein [unclassified Microcoleus]TAE76433.1 MAG: hypothetical protein EAZ83_28230 [Oscillatoriales cyanobacterium]MCC3409294.1 hypothetical protein [Microcoleus sp. PH2017_10_PVI_O_A]MCC3463527.1 hypothetical protein [Microcoleus sp. PH2017_11_PCY_U_A]MCC3481881.1 hypothetical protein [Microcoleus sp. PH2017_12_PCY_D_A]MCC3531808.1 hypothetical protein [Microcoleus sp. PH2017_21_RUC_O_A]